jgi:hypothetical protein
VLTPVISDGSVYLPCRDRVPPRERRVHQFIWERQLPMALREEGPRADSTMQMEGGPEPPRLGPCSCRGPETVIATSRGQQMPRKQRPSLAFVTAVGYSATKQKGVQ